MQDARTTCPPEYLELQLHRENILAPYPTDSELLTARKALAFIACLSAETKASEIKRKIASNGVTTVPG